jgi:hypothetical protein
MAKKANAKQSAKKAKKAVKTAGIKTPMMTVKIPKGTAKDPFPDFTMKVPGGGTVLCKYSKEAGKYICG